MAASPTTIQFRFESDACDPGTFEVVDVQGFEQLSTLYEFQINLASEDGEIDLAALSREAARLVFVLGDEEHKVHGVLAECNETGRGQTRTRYRVVLVPRLWLTSLQFQNQVHQNQTVEQTLEEELLQSGFVKDDDFEIRLSGSYPEREYVVQYEETDLNFLQRQMEHYGIFYYFEQGEDKEKLVIADANSAFPTIPGAGGSDASSDSSGSDEHVPYRPSSGMAEEAEYVYGLTCTQTRMPNKLVLSDYNYRTPSVPLRVEQIVSPEGRGIVSRYGDHFKTPDEGRALAEVRAQEILAREKVFAGESSVLRFRAGATFTLDEHPRSDVSGHSYLLTMVTHSGSQPTRGEEDEAAQSSTYQNSFTCIPAETAFRPARETPKPKLYGVLNAKVDAAGSGQYAEIDDHGRYKVKLPFDLTNAGDGQASRYMRKTEPYAGPGYGQHFPLHKDCEVLLTCVDGDPDRPVIVGSVPNPEQASPVNNTNQATSAIRTGGGNFIELDDTAGSERIKMTSPNSNTYFHLGAANQEWNGACIETDGQMNVRASDLWFSSTGATREDHTDGDYTERIGGHHNYTVLGGQEGHVSGGDCELTVDGDHLITVTGDTKVTDTSKNWTNNGSKLELTYGASAIADLSLNEKFTAGAQQETFVGVKNSNQLAACLSYSAGISWTRSGVAEKVSAPRVSASATADWRASAPSVNLLGSADCYCDAPDSTFKGTSTCTIEGGGAKIILTGNNVTIEAAEVHIKGKLTVDKKSRIAGRDIGAD